MNYSPLECPICTYNRNSFDATNCELCETPLAQIANLTTARSLSPHSEKVMRHKFLNAASAALRTKDSLGNIDIKAKLSPFVSWSKQLSKFSTANANVPIVSTTRSAVAQMHRHLVKISQPRQQNDTEDGLLLEQSGSKTKLLSAEQQGNLGASLSPSDPWLSDSPQLNSTALKVSSKSKAKRENPVGIEQHTNNLSNWIIANRLRSSKTLITAKVLLILTAMFGIGCVTTILIYNRYNEEELSTTYQEQPPSIYSDIKLYDTMKSVANVPEGLFSYGGALCFAALQRDGMNAAISNAHPSFLLRYVEPKFSNPGCTTGIKMLLNGELSIAQNSRPLTEAEVNVASSRGYKLESIPVAIDGIVFYTNKSVGVKSLSLEQLRDIYFGKIRNWKQVGGKDLPITPIGLDPKIDSILRLLMETRNTPLIGDNVVIARDFTSAIRKTGSTPGAISYASSAILKGQRSVAPIALSANSDSPSVSAILADGMVNLQAFEKNVYPLTRRLFVVIRRDGSPEEKAGVAYTNMLLSEEGQKIFERAGFVPLYSSGGNKSQ